MPHYMFDFFLNKEIFGVPLDVLGLILDVGGVLLLFLFELPNRIGEGNFLMIDGVDSKEKEKKFRFGIYSRIGLILLLFGFIFQILYRIL